MFNNLFQPADVIFVGGLDGAGYKRLDEQVKIFKRGFGQSKAVIAFRYNANPSEIVKAIRRNHNATIVLFSAGCTQLKSILNSNAAGPSRIYLIEPYGPNQRLTQTIISNRFPTENIYVGTTKSRGRGIVEGTSNSGSASHWGALESVARIIK